MTDRTRVDVRSRDRRSAGLAVLPLLLALYALLTPCIPAAGAATPADDTIYQVSTYGALSAGEYQGAAPLRSLPMRGAVGLGTFKGLSGEMAVLDGTVYQALADGSVVRPRPSSPTPFALVTHFEADRSTKLSGIVGYPALQAGLDDLRKGDNYFYAFRIHGAFNYLKIRSVPRQPRPFPTLEVALQSQVIWETHNVKGTMVGFWCHDWIGSINVPGYHLHFVSDDRRTAGHVLDVNVDLAKAQADITRRLRLLLPGTGAFMTTPL
jgi:acetolactate decarboxylase